MRVGRKSSRLLLKTVEPRKILARVMALHCPIHSLANVTVHACEEW
jgi:hypothetical protein